MNSIFKKPKTPFLTATFRDIFFDGVIVNCSVTDFAGKAVCTQLKTEGKDFEYIEENVFKFSLLGAVSARHYSRINFLSWLIFIFLPC